MVSKTAAIRHFLLAYFATATERRNEERAIFAAGCFWSVELAYQRVPGVLRTSVGYAGGHTPTPTYRMVTTGRTGHAEAVEVVYDPSVVPFRRLVDLFWKIHDPTSLNRQGGDFGTQYRSAIWYEREEQRVDIETSLASLPRADDVVTQIAPMASSDFIWHPAGLACPSDSFA